MSAVRFRPPAPPGALPGAPDCRRTARRRAATHPLIRRVRDRPSVPGRPNAGPPGTAAAAATTGNGRFRRRPRCRRRSWFRRGAGEAGRQPTAAPLRVGDSSDAEPAGRPDPAPVAAGAGTTGKGKWRRRRWSFSGGLSRVVFPDSGREPETPGGDRPRLVGDSSDSGPASRSEPGPADGGRPRDDREGLGGVARRRRSVPVPPGPRRRRRNPAAAPSARRRRSAGPRAGRPPRPPAPVAAGAGATGKGRWRRYRWSVPECGREPETPAVAGRGAGRARWRFVGEAPGRRRFRGRPSVPNPGRGGPGPRRCYRDGEDASAAVVSVVCPSPVR